MRSLPVWHHDVRIASLSKRSRVLLRKRMTSSLNIVVIHSVKEWGHPWPVNATEPPWPSHLMEHTVDAILLQNHPVLQSSCYAMVTVDRSAALISDWTHTKSFFISSNWSNRDIIPRLTYCSTWRRDVSLPDRLRSKSPKSSKSNRVICSRAACTEQRFLLPPWKYNSLKVSTCACTRICCYMTACAPVSGCVHVCLCVHQAE